MYFHCNSYQNVPFSTPPKNTNINIKKFVVLSMYFKTKSFQWCHQHTWWDMRVWTPHNFVVSKPFWFNGSKDSKSWHSISTMENIINNSLEVVPVTNKMLQYNHQDLSSNADKNRQSKQLIRWEGERKRKKREEKTTGNNAPFQA